MLKYNNSNLRENEKVQKCKNCGINLKEFQEKRVYVECQRIEIFSNELGEKSTMWLTQNYINKLEVGSEFSAVCYYDVFINFYQNNLRLKHIKINY